jgi:hypothetical protein
MPTDQHQAELQKAKNEIARAMLCLHNLKRTASPSGHKQLAELIVQLGQSREQVGKVEK